MELTIIYLTIKYDRIMSKNKKIPSTGNERGKKVQPMKKAVDNKNSVNSTAKKGTPKSISKLFDEILDSIEPINFENEVNFNGTSDVKVKQKEYVTISIEKINSIIISSGLGLCIENNQTYLYNNCYWDVVGDDELKSFLSNAAIKLGTPVLDAKYHQFGKDLYKQFRATSFFKAPNNSKNIQINLLNGTLEFSKKEFLLKGFKSDDFIKYQLNFKYDPNSQSPLFKIFLNEVLPSKSMQDLVAEYLGSIFINKASSIKIEKVMVFLGNGANGKSVLFEVINKLLGTENVSNYSLQSLTDVNGYFRALLENKLLNYSSEMNGNIEFSIFKQLASQERVAARLPYKEPIILDNYARLLFNSNVLPENAELTNAFFRRLIIVPFDVTIKEKDQDKELHLKLFKELPGILNWILEGLSRLIKNKKFTQSNKADELIKKYEIESDSLKLFLRENNYKKSIDNKLKIKDLYLKYKTFCLEDNYRAINKAKFIKRLNIEGIEIKRINIGNVAYLEINNKL